MLPPSQVAVAVLYVGRNYSVRLSRRSACCLTETGPSSLVEGNGWKPRSGVKGLVDNCSIACKHGILC